MTQLIGTAPNQVPTNGSLGTMAFQDEKSVNILGGNASLTNAIAQVIQNDTAISNEKPTLNLDFANSKTLDPRITYARASTATYYDGVTSAVAEQNLLTNSGSLSGTPWNTAGVASLTLNSSTAPDGTSTASLLTSLSSSSNTTGVYETTITSSSIASTFSVYGKAGTSGFLCLANGSTAYANFNLNTGAVASSSGCTASIVSVGSGWYRCIMANALFTGPIVVGKDADPAAYPWSAGTMTSGNNLYIWGAQLEQRSAVTAYNATTSTALTNYIPVMQTAASGAPRFDHDARQVLTGTGTVSGATLTLPTTFSDGSAPSTQDGFYTNQTVTIGSTSYTVSAHNASSGILTLSGSPTSGSQSFLLTNPDVGRSLGFLIEQQSTNLLTYSSDYTQSAWIKGSQPNVGIAANAIVAPDGSVTGTKLYDSNTASANRFIYQYPLLTAQQYTMSVYAKAAEYSYLNINCSTGTNVGCYFNLSSGTVGPTASGFTASMVSVGDGWYRCSVTFTGTAANWYIEIDNSPTNNSGYYPHTGVVNSGIYIWGAQLEASAFPTSYIPTVASQVTRAADAASMTGVNFSSWFNTGQGTFAAEAVSTGALLGSVSTSYGIYSVSSGTYVNSMNGFINVNGGVQRFYCDTTVNANAASTFLYTGAVRKNAFSYKSGSYSAYFDSVTVNPSPNNFSFIPAVSTLFIGNLYTPGSFILNGTIKRLTYYPKALTSAELQEMTS